MNLEVNILLALLDLANELVVNIQALPYLLRLLDGGRSRQHQSETLVLI
jgi:hypothetical protein